MVGLATGNEGMRQGNPIQKTVTPIVALDVVEATLRLWGEYAASGAAADAELRGYPRRSAHVPRPPRSSRCGHDPDRAAAAQVRTLAGLVEEILPQIEPRLRVILRQRYQLRMPCRTGREDVRLVGAGGGRMGEREYQSLRKLAVERVGQLLGHRLRQSIR